MRAYIVVEVREFNALDGIENQHCKPLRIVYVENAVHAAFGEDLFYDAYLLEVDWAACAFYLFVIFVKRCADRNISFGCFPDATEMH